MNQPVSRRARLSRDASVVRGLLLTLTALSLLACSEDAPKPGTTAGSGAGTFAGMAGTTATAGTSGTAGTGDAGTTGAAGSSAGTTAGTGNAAGTGSAGTSGGKTFDPGTDPNRNAVTAGKLCQRLAEIQCAGEAFCCDNPGRTVDQCRQAQRQICMDSSHLDEVAQKPEAGFDPAVAKTTYTAFENMVGKCDQGVAAWGEMPTGLRGIFKGTVAPNKSCYPKGDPTDPANGGAALASCTGGDTTACLPMGLTTWTCTSKSAANGACFSDLNCKSGLFCDNPDGNLVGSMCKMRKAIGASCGKPNECASLFCVQGKCGDVNQQHAYCLKQ